MEDITAMMHKDLREVHHIAPEVPVSEIPSHLQHHYLRKYYSVDLLSDFFSYMNTREPLEPGIDWRSHFSVQEVSLEDIRSETISDVVMYNFVMRDQNNEMFPGVYVPADAGTFEKTGFDEVMRSLPFRRFYVGGFLAYEPLEGEVRPVFLGYAFSPKDDGDVRVYNEELVL